MRTVCGDSYAPFNSCSPLALPESIKTARTAAQPSGAILTYELTAVDYIQLIQGFAGEAAIELISNQLSLLNNTPVGNGMSLTEI